MISAQFVGLDRVGKRINRIAKKIESEPEKEMLNAGREVQLYAILQAPKRTGELAKNIKLVKGKDYVSVQQRMPGYPYPLLIDRNLVSPNWGTNTGDPRMIDKRSREQKLNYFIGTEGMPGKSLIYAYKNFPAHANNLLMRIMR